MKYIDKIKEYNIYEMAMFLSKLVHPQYVEPFREEHIRVMLEFLESEELKYYNNGRPISNAEYLALSNKGLLDADTLYFITDAEYNKNSTTPRASKLQQCIDKIKSICTPLCKATGSEGYGKYVYEDSDDLVPKILSAIEKVNKDEE